MASLSASEVPAVLAAAAGRMARDEREGRKAAPDGEAEEEDVRIRENRRLHIQSCRNDDLLNSSW